MGVWGGPAAGVGGQNGYWRDSPLNYLDNSLNSLRCSMDLTCSGRQTHSWQRRKLRAQEHQEFAQKDTLDFSPQSLDKPRGDCPGMSPHGLQISPWETGILDPRVPVPPFPPPAKGEE